MKKLTGKELRQNTEKTINSLLSELDIQSPSRRTRKIVEKVSRRLSKGLKQEMKKQLKKNQRATKKPKVRVGKHEKEVTAA
jgi:hypothetical protein